MVKKHDDMKQAWATNLTVSAPMIKSGRLPCVCNEFATSIALHLAVSFAYPAGPPYAPFSSPSANLARRT